MKDLWYKNTILYSLERLTWTPIAMVEGTFRDAPSAWTLSLVWELLA